MKVYYIYRGEDGVKAEVLTDVKNGKEVSDIVSLKHYDLPHVVRHSPTGFEFGYLGSGPSDLARSILYDLDYDAEKIESWYHDFKKEFIANQEGESFIICEDAIQLWWEAKQSNESL